MKRVAIVGAGPAGLVTAKNLLRYSPDEFDVTVFEKQDRVGGMWALRPGELHRGKVSPQMPTNLSRHTVSFSDLAWSSVNFQNGPLAGKEASPLPVYPRAWQVGAYLEEYAKRYLPAERLKLNATVEHAQKVETDGKTQWKVTWVPVETNSADDICNGSKGDAKNTALFDHIVVGSGFFNTPRNPSFKVGADFTPRIIHSTAFRTMTDLIPKPPVKAGKIVVVGGSMSGAEAAVSIALAQSDMLHSPAAQGSAFQHEIIHVTSRPFYDLPRLHPRPSEELPEGKTDHSPAFLPNDLNMFDFTKRPPGPIVPSNGLTDPEKAKMTHGYMQSIIGGDQSDLESPGLKFAKEHGDRPPFLAITDSYTEFVRSGIIKTVLGRLTELEQSGSNRLGTGSVVNEKGQKHELDHIIGVVHATGFTPHTALRWLDDAIRKDLDVDERSDRVPVILHHHTTYHPAHPDLAFVGMYEGAFWGVMEMQARETVKRWSAPGNGQPIELDWEEPDMKAMRDAMSKNSNDVAQFWMGDYLSIVDALAPRHGIVRSDEVFGGRTGPTVAARYTTEKDDREEAKNALADLKSTVDGSGSHDRFVQGAIFRGLQGVWSVTRKLESFLAGFPSGTLHGHAYFHPRFPSAAGFDAEYLYAEDGTVTTDAGLTLKANKKYVYRYSEIKDQISVWFVKEDGRTVDYFFQDIKLSPKSQESHNTGWMATGSHWCDPDRYDCNYRFKFRGATLQDLNIKYIAKGPSKNYVSDTLYERP